MKIANLEQLKEIKEQGLRLTYPDKIKIMVGMATCGISAGADKVYAALAQRIAELGLDVVLAKTGCIGFCQREPLVDVVYPKQVRLTYQAMTPETAVALVDALKEGRIYDRPEPCAASTRKIFWWRAWSGPMPTPTPRNCRRSSPDMKTCLSSASR